jgi:hypothetical protein
MNPNLENPKNPNNYCCIICDFITCNKKDYTRHNLTRKHKILTNPNKILTEKPQKTQDDYICTCGKTYKHKSTLCAHKKKCKINCEKDEIQETDSNLIVELLKQNQDFKEMLMEQNTKMIETFNEALKNNNSITTNNHVNSHNKTFNMNVFLNEHCKDAMNISEFVDSIQLGFNDLVNVGKVGYVEGISSIIINKLRALDIHKRPMHCGDEKRHSMYIKEDGKWEKQPEDNNRVRRLIKQVAFKNTKNTVLFKQKYPDCGTSESKYSDQYNKIVMESFGGRGASDEDKENKIVRMIAREVYIDKTL